MRDDRKQQVQAATDIVQLIGEQLALKPKGREFLALCPFHDDHKPSMSVVPVKQIFHCFSCGTGGDVFGWMMKYHKMAFPEALRFLADRAGIQLPTYGGGPKREGPSDRQLVLDANTKAREFFQDLLNNSSQGQVAKQHLEQRGVSPQMVQDFGLGYAPDSWDGLSSEIADRGWDTKSFEMAGLIAKRKNHDGHYDKLRHRLIFPIGDAIGQPIAFGGRVLPDTQREDRSDAKYLNSPETVLFNKSSTLYGLDLSMKSIIAGKTAVVVEGYTDVIACHQAGFTNVVATLGTAFTAQHVTQLKNRAEKVILVFDGDEAGQKAADRAVEVFLTQAVDVHVATLADGLDPADLLAKPEGAELFTAGLDHARDALSYQFDRVSEQMDAQETITGRQNLSEQYLQKLAGMGLNRVGAIRRAMLMQRLSELLHLPEDQIIRIVESFARRRPAFKPPASNSGANPNGPGATSASRPADSGSSSPALGEYPDMALEDPALQDPGFSGPPDQNEGDEDHSQDISTVSDLVPPRLQHRIRAVQMAERQLLGCLIQEASLMDPGTESGQLLGQVDASVFLTKMAGALFDLLCNQIASGQAVTLANLLGEVAQQPDNELLANLATQVDSEVEQLIEADPHRRGQLAVETASTLLRFSKERGLESRESLVEKEQSDDEAIRRFMEHHKNNPSPARIGRAR